MSFGGDPLAFQGKLLIETHDASLLEGLKRQLSWTRDQTIPPDLLSIVDDTPANLVDKKVGILGAGIGGLYTALLLDSIDVDYEILEASDRIGGRLQTHKFEGGGNYDYYEAGAMRFPLPEKDENGDYKDGIMARLGDLINYDPLNKGSDPLRDRLIPYYKVAQDPDHPAFYYINEINYPMGKNEPSGFRAKEMGVNDAYINAYRRGGPGVVSNDAIEPFARMLINDLKNGTKDGWAMMLEHDAYSFGGYLATKYLPSPSLELPQHHIPVNVVNWYNLLLDSSGGNDRGLSDTVFLDLAFAAVGEKEFGKVEWKCFRGGSETLSKKIGEYLETRNESFVKFKKRVTAIDQISTRYSIPGNYKRKPIPSSATTALRSGVIHVDVENGSSEKIEVTYPRVRVTTNRSESYEYGHVISTLPLPVLRTVNLKNASLNILQQNALRALSYGPSIKIAVRFKSNWWTTKLGIVGGESVTDLPLRNIVYPSYGEPCDPSKVLIASYVRTTDASRLSALASENVEELKDLVLHNLAWAHHGVNDNTDITYEFLKSELADGENFHVKDWNNDRYTMGAFASFSPGQFGDLFSSLTCPAADDCLHFAGEAVSTRHGWVVGALDSAWRAVYHYLKITRQKEKLDVFLQKWRKSPEWMTKSTLAGTQSKYDLLDEHLALVRKSILIGESSSSSPV